MAIYLSNGRLTRILVIANEPFPIENCGMDSWIGLEFADDPVSRVSASIYPFDLTLYLLLISLLLSLVLRLMKFARLAR